MKTWHLTKSYLTKYLMGSTHSP